MAKKIKINNKKKSHKITTVMTASHERTVILSRQKKGITTTTFSFIYPVHCWIQNVSRNVLCLTMFR